MAQSVVDDQGVYKTTCGYCRSGARSSVSHGMYAQQLAVEDYQALINRGWRRSGNFLYKPAMERTCCPPYTIRLDVNDFVPSKEQKMVLRRMERYLNGDLELNETSRVGLADGSKPDDGVKQKGAKQKWQSVRKGKRDRETPSPSERQGTADGSSPGAERLRTGETDGAQSGSGSDAAAKASEERVSGGAVMEIGGLPTVLSSSKKPGTLQINELAQSPEQSLLQEIRVQVQQCVAELVGGPCPIPVAAKAVPRKVQRKLEKRKEEAHMGGETMYTSNVAFVLAAHRTKVEGASGTEGRPSGNPFARATAGSSARGERAKVGPEPGESSPAAIAEALAAKLRRRQVGSGEWRVESCVGHLNFYAPAAQLVGSKEARRRSTGSAFEKTVQQDEAAREKPGEAQPKRRKRFEMRMSRSKFDKEEYLLYRKYQIRVHNDAPHEISEGSYRRFLVDSPLKAPPVAASPPGNDETGFSGFGSFHQQYRIDGRLIAVGVVDVLPQCLSSKYLFWDPDLAPLSLGKFSALKEIEWVRKAQQRAPALHYYYLGYYIHNCNKMRYKAAYSPSQLLCPVHYSWQPHSAARHVLDRRPYADLCHTGENAGGADGDKSQGAAGPRDGGQPGEGRFQQRRRPAGVTGSDGLVAARADGQSVGRAEAASENEAGPRPPQSRGDGQAKNEEAATHHGGVAGVSDAAMEGVGVRKDLVEGSPVDERDQGMLEFDPEDGVSLDESDESDSESESEMGDELESSGREGSGAVSVEELGEVPLMLGGTVIPFRFFQQLGMLPPAAVRLLLSRLRPYHVAVGPELASRLVYSLG